jgi:hypothetical protein
MHVQVPATYYKWFIESLLLTDLTSLRSGSSDRETWEVIPKLLDFSVDIFLHNFQFGQFGHLVSLMVGQASTAVPFHRTTKKWSNQYDLTKKP